MRLIKPLKHPFTKTHSIPIYIYIITLTFPIIIFYQSFNDI